MYQIDLDPEAREQLDAVPAQALAALAETLAMLELTPWIGSPQHSANPDGAVRWVLFGKAGMVIYLILEDQRRVDVLKVLWMG
jgi:hypothetical protein